ncbi:MAG: AAA family ATPase [Candidatus Omnitrophota bacterium]
MTEEKRLKQIPYGISDYDIFSEENYYYVDKTRYIRNIEEKGRYLFFIRPRRFGKSLFLSILEDYYDIAQKDRFDFFFEGTDIHRHPTEERNKYLIFKLNFSRVNSNVEVVERAFLNHIKSTALYFIKKYKKLLDIDIEDVKDEFRSSLSATELMNSLLDFCWGQNQKIYIIIDEYDNFANTILSTAGQNIYHDITHGEGFLRSFFNVIKGGTTGSGAAISRLFMTGVSPITLDDVTSGFNIAKNISLDSDINEILGFTRTEVETAVNYYRQTGKIKHSTPELMEIMGRFYNHYRFALHAETDLFNPVQVLYFLDEYMKESQIPESLIDRNVRMDYQKLRHLIVIDQKGKPKTNGNFSKLQQIIEKGSVHSIIEKSFPLSGLMRTGNFVSLLYYFGLLSIRGTDEENNTILAIPNESIKHLYYDYIQETSEEIGLLTIDPDKYTELMNDMAYRGQWLPLVDYIAGRMEASLSLRDLMTREKALQVFWNVYLGLSDLYIVHSEKEMNQGFSDLVLEPWLVQYPNLKYSYVIEIKYMSPSSVDAEGVQERIRTLAEEAETQLRQYSADERFQKIIGKTKLKKLILVFLGHRLVYKDEVH